ncbi:hypothetical protein BGZ47_009983 [Haplosporangium gracile]|nr:hypothetical protein BGZ47_009983 [Haplosporangium gracile]
MVIPPAHQSSNDSTIDSVVNAVSVTPPLSVPQPWLQYSFKMSLHLRSSVVATLDPYQQASVGAILQSEEGQSKIRELTTRVIEEFAADSLKTSDEISEGLVQLVQCAGPDNLKHDDLVHILTVLRARLQEIHLQTTSSDPYLKHQAGYALQSLLHVPNDEIRRQYVLRQAGNITMGLLGVASVCKLDMGQLKDGVNHLYKAAGDAHEFDTKVVGGVQALLESGQDIASSVKGGILSSVRQLWYTAPREAQEHTRNGRLTDFNHLGVCLLFGEIAVDPQWVIATCKHAVNLLAELYKSDTNWNSNGDIHKWILNIILQVSILFDTAISDHAKSLLEILKKEGDIGKRTLCHDDVLAEFVYPYPLQARLPAPLSSPSPARVQVIPDVEYDLRRLSTQRMRASDNPLYISPQAKSSTSDNTLFPLMEKALEILNSCGQHTLWKEYKRGGPIPLYINPPTIVNPQQNMTAKQLQQLDFSDAQIQELKHHRQLIAICDGYDESQLKKNLYTANLFNQPRQWEVKYVQKKGTATSDFSAWEAINYWEKLVNIPNLMDPVRHPFLTLALRALARIVSSQ